MIETNFGGRVRASLTFGAGDLTTVCPNEFHRFVALTDVEPLEIYNIAETDGDNRNPSRRAEAN